MLVSYFTWPRWWRWKCHVPPKRQLTFDGLYNVMSQKVELFITTTVRTSNPTKCQDYQCSTTLKTFYSEKHETSRSREQRNTKRVNERILRKCSFEIISRTDRKYWEEVRVVGRSRLPKNNRSSDESHEAIGNSVWIAVGFRYGRWPCITSLRTGERSVCCKRLN
jgi:hypothetical protein